MSVAQAEVLKQIYLTRSKSLADLVKLSKLSLGKVKDCVAELIRQGLVTENLCVTEAGRKLMEFSRPQKAVIMATEPSLSVPESTFDQQRDLLEAKGQRTVERLIKQLQEKNITKIVIIADSKVEKYRYLKKKFQVELATDLDTGHADSLAALAALNEQLENCYLISSNLYCAAVPFSEYELYSWYGLRSPNRQVRQEELEALGLAYLTKDDAETIRLRLIRLANDPQQAQLRWETCLMDGQQASVNLKIFPAQSIVRFNSYRELRKFDPGSRSLPNKALEIGVKLKSFLTEKHFV
ncbi:hypothetical protein LFYK43_08280 [Ligilactobacillus salitolerans]|uniref:Uncharacterized protein n=1 Tax=Ligilactobacillus salitolerans TaxID=1808352 RepID=A0A401IS62_9LACO|nr:hypothetical protein [Ligilactobacillus salitolerans]GBG94369.1 hypothetical protein LFYK43_08280 [Ligilactobacillus salitolerans]